MEAAQDGERGDVQPLRHRRTRLGVGAHRTPQGAGARGRAPGDGEDRGLSRASCHARYAWGRRSRRRRARRRRRRVRHVVGDDGGAQAVRVDKHRRTDALHAPLRGKRAPRERAQVRALPAPRGGRARRGRTERGVHRGGGRSRRGEERVTVGRRGGRAGVGRGDATVREPRREPRREPHGDVGRPRRVRGEVRVPDALLRALLARDGRRLRRLRLLGRSVRVRVQVHRLRRLPQPRHVAAVQLTRARGRAQRARRRGDARRVAPAMGRVGVHGPGPRPASRRYQAG
mmetsp:Transcript_2035/g.8957  ORF Transcript_2035/g.8957 Transcript_2035/m.8957 type:complete len:287 (+) Transcript_2035:327-1187(+)